jgi:hypothetical protein
VRSSAAHHVTGAHLITVVIINFDEGAAVANGRNSRVCGRKSRRPRCDLICGQTDYAERFQFDVREHFALIWD